MMGSPNTPAPEATVGNLPAKKLSTNEQAIPVPYFGGRRWLSLIQAQTRVYNGKAKAVTEKVGKGKSITGYDYYGDLVGVTSCGAVDLLEAIEVNGKVVWAEPGGIERDGTNVHHTGDIVVAGVGTFRLYWGTDAQPMDDLVLATCGEPHPRYLDQAYLVAKDVYFGNNNSTPPTIRVLVERAAVFAGLPSDRSREGTNPITVLAEILTNDFFGLGLSSDIIDLPSWSALATAIRRDTPVSVPGDSGHTAAMGFFSPYLDRSQSARAFIAQILEHFDGWIRPQDGKLIIGQFPHDGVTPTGLTELSYHDFVEGRKPQFQPSDDTEIITDVTIVHLDRDVNMEETATPVPNPAARRRVGEDREKTFRRPFIHTTYQAREQGNQLARLYSREEEACQVSVRREKVAGLHAGDRFVLVDSPTSSSQIVRITRREDLSDGGEVNLSLVLERGLAPVAFVPPPNPTPILPDPDLVAIVNARIFQLPSAWGDYAPAPAIVALAERPGGHVAGFTAHFSPAGTTYDQVATIGRWALRGTLAAGIASGVTSLTLNASGFDLATLAAQTDAAKDDDTLLLICGFEVMSIGNVVALGGGQYTVTVARGRRGSAAAAHSISAVAYVIRREDLVVLQHADFPRTTTAQYFKLASYTKDEEQELADALAITFTFDDTGVDAPGSLAATAKAEAIFVSWTYPNPPDPTIVATDLWVRTSATTPVPGTDAPDHTLLATGFNLGGLAAGATRYIWAQNRDTIGRSTLVGPVSATALAAPTGPPGSPGTPGAPGADGDDGDDGLDGPGVPFRGNYDNTKAYFYIAGLRRDAVFYSGQYWATNNPGKNGLTTWDPPGTNADWISYGATYSAIATGLLLAEDATITKTLTIGTDGSNHGIVQSANFVTSGGSAGWQLKDDGTLTANNGVFRGELDVGTGDNRFYKPVSGPVVFGDSSQGHVSVNSPASGFSKMAIKYGSTSYGGMQTANVGGSIVGAFDIFSTGGSTGLTIFGNVSSSVAPIITWAADTNLRRESANLLKTDDDFAVAGEILAGDDIVFNGTQRLRFDGAGSLISYIQEGYGINLWGDNTHPVHLRNCSLIRGGSSGADYGTGNIHGFGVEFNPSATLPNVFRTGTTSGGDQSMSSYLILNHQGGTIYVPYFTSP